MQDNDFKAELREVFTYGNTRYYMFREGDLCQWLDFVANRNLVPKADRIEIRDFEDLHDGIACLEYRQEALGPEIKKVIQTLKDGYNYALDHQVILPLVQLFQIKPELANMYVGTELKSW